VRQQNRVAFRLPEPDEHETVAERRVDVARPLELVLPQLLVQLVHELGPLREAVEQRLRLLPLAESRFVSSSA
jgi:hypothetical protein